MATKKQRLDEAMGNIVLDSNKILSRIKSMMHDLPAPESDELNWGHVGTAHAIWEHLSEAHDILVDCTGRSKGGDA